MGAAAADLARCQYLPLNACEWVRLLNTVLISFWTYRTLFLPNDSMFKAMDSMCLRFVLMAEGMELNKVDVHKSYNVLHVTSPHRLGGMGLHQLFYAHKAHLTTMVQTMLRSPLGSIGCDLSKEPPCRTLAIRNYLATLPLGGHGARGIPPCHHCGHTVPPPTAKQDVPSLRWQPSNSCDRGLGLSGGGRSSDKRASSHPRPGGRPTTVLRG